MGLKDTLVGWGWLRDQRLERQSPLSFEQWQQFLFDGNTYGFGGVQWTMPRSETEAIAATFAGFVNAAYRRNGVVAACMLARESLFCEARFQYRRFSVHGHRRDGTEPDCLRCAE